MNGDRLDAAVLRLQPLPNGPAELPESITVSASPNEPLGRSDQDAMTGSQTTARNWIACSAAVTMVTSA